MLWTRPDLSDYGPLVAGGLGVRFIGSWAAFLAILAGWAAVRAGLRDTRMPLLALVLWPLAALVAAILHLDELRSGFPAVSYLGALSVLTGLAGLVMCSPRVTRSAADCSIATSSCAAAGSHPRFPVASAQ